MKERKIELIDRTLRGLNWQDHMLQRSRKIWIQWKEKIYLPSFVPTRIIGAPGA